MSTESQKAARREYQAKWLKSHPHYYQTEKRRESRRVAQAKYRLSHLDYYADYRQSHREERSIYNSNWHQEHREATNSRKSLYERSHREQIRKKLQRWRDTNRAKERGYNAHRRAIKRQSPIGIVDFQEILARDKYLCGICHARVKPSDLHFDHIIPLSQGGVHANHNVQVTHRTCNLIKGSNGKLPSQIRLPF